MAATAASRSEAFDALSAGAQFRDRIAIVAHAGSQNEINESELSRGFT
jgi:hypothetical protein